MSKCSWLQRLWHVGWSRSSMAVAPTGDPNSHSGKEIFRRLKVMLQVQRNYFHGLLEPLEHCYKEAIKADLFLFYYYDVSITEEWKLIGPLYCQGFWPFWKQLQWISLTLLCDIISRKVLKEMLSKPEISYMVICQCVCYKFGNFIELFWTKCLSKN